MFQPPNATSTRLFQPPQQPQQPQQQPTALNGLQDQVQPTTMITQRPPSMYYQNSTPFIPHTQYQPIHYNNNNNSTQIGGDQQQQQQQSVDDFSSFPNQQNDRVPFLPQQQQQQQRPPVQQSFFAPNFTQQPPLQQQQQQQHFQYPPQFQSSSHHQQQQQQLSDAQHLRHLKQEESTSKLLFILGFLCCWIWLITYLKYKKSPSEKARRFARYSRNIFILSIIVSVLLSAAWFFIVMGAAVGARGGGGHHYHPNGDHHSAQEQKPKHHRNHEKMMDRMKMMVGTKSNSNQGCMKQFDLKNVKAFVASNPAVVIDGNSQGEQIQIE